jgi:putative ABC transport system permease protein
MQRETLSTMLREGPSLSGAFVAVEPDSVAALQHRLERMPSVAGVTQRENAIRAFNELMDETMLLFTLFIMFMAGSIAFAVVYNNARIALAERSREMATLRVLGFTRGETSFILLGELMLLTLLALPLGFLFGIGLIWLLIMSIETDLYRIPMIISADTFALAAAVVLVATLISAWLISRRAARLDMVSALKAAE